MIGNYSASGTEIIRVLGEEHRRTGSPIVYTSADSVFQVAANVEVIPMGRFTSIVRRPEAAGGPVAGGQSDRASFYRKDGNYVNQRTPRLYLRSQE